MPLVDLEFGMAPRMTGMTVPALSFSSRGSSHKQETSDTTIKHVKVNSSAPEYSEAGLVLRWSESCQDLICPITGDIMVDPVIASDGFNYERAAIVAVIDDTRI